MDAAVMKELFPDPEALRRVDEKGQLPDDFRNGVMRKLRSKSDARSCFECNERNPTWCSVSFGVYLCLHCSGEHRRKGVHISYVRSVEMDKFYPDQLVQMACGGNSKAWSFFQSCGMGKLSDSGRTVDYSSKMAVKYKADLDKLMKATCAVLGVPERCSDPTAVASPVASPVGGEQPAAAATSPQAVEPVPAPAKWQVGQRVQYKDKVSGTWKWGSVTHCKPLKVDYSAKDEVRENPSSKVLDAAAQRAMAFAPAPAAPAPAAAVAAAPPSPVRPAAKESPSPAESPGPATSPPKTFVVRKSSSTEVSPGPSHASTNGGYPAAQSPLQLETEKDPFDMLEAPEVFKPKPTPAPAAAVVEEVATAPASSPAAAPPPAAKGPLKEMEKELDFDFDF